MAQSRRLTQGVALALCLVLAGCGDNSPLGRITAGPAAGDPLNEAGRARMGGQPQGGSSFWDLFGPDRTDQVVNVNKYLWNASLDVLGFLPLRQVDPFTGLIVTGFGTPPGGGRAYRATIHIVDPALEARSLRLSMQTQSGPVSPATQRAIEDAIMTRARQLRIADDAL